MSCEHESNCPDKEKKSLEQLQDAKILIEYQACNFERITMSHYQDYFQHNRDTYEPQVPTPPPEC